MSIRSFFLSINILLLLSSCNSSKEDGKNDKHKRIQKSSNKIKSIIKTIHNEYILEKPINDLEKNAITGIMKSLDEYCQYFSQEEFEYVENTINNSNKNNVGIGLFVHETKNGEYKVIDIFPGSKSSKKDIQLGDVLTKINDRNISEIKNVRRLLHSINSDISLDFSRSNNKFKILFKKDSDSKDVLIKIIDNNLLVIKMPFIQKDMSLEIRKFIKNNIKNKKINGIILDLRNNPGGDIKEAKEILGLFLKKKLCYSIKGRSKSDLEKVYTSSNIIFKPIPTIAIVNKFTASSAEIIASSLKFYKRAIVVGEKTYGKNRIQTLFKIPGIGGLKITTSEFLTPSNENIYKIGISPDIELEKESTENINNSDKWMKSAINIIKVISLRGNK